MIVHSRPRPKTGLYIHIPFCSQKCFFCSFVVCVARTHRIDEYLECLASEAKKHEGSRVDTVYIGGGTPTLLNEAQLLNLRGLVKKYFKIAKGAEFSIETNPDTMDLPKAKLLRSLGVNRLSIGAQTFDNAALRFLGRTHRANDIRQCFDIARQAGFANINLDMMFGFPRQSWNKLQRDLSQALELKGEHISAYNLAVDPNSRFHRIKLSLPSQEALGKLYADVTSYLEDHGFAQYEISNFSKPGRESAHNTLYWECENYIGLGIGAHSHFHGRRSWNICELYPYITRVQKGRTPVGGSERLGRQRRFTETLLFGLRMNKGVDVLRLEERFSCRLPAAKKEQIEKFVEQGFFILEKEVLKTTLKGRLVLDELCGYLI